MAALAEAAQTLALAFVPLFVALDPLGNLPFFLGLTRDLTPAERRRVTHVAILTALGIGLGFMLLGQAVFAFLGIGVAEFLVAGGIILFIVSVRDLVREQPTTRRAAEDAGTRIGIVPLGTPLLAGPAVLAMLLLLQGQYGAPIVVLAFLLNLAVTWAAFLQANTLARLLRPAGMEATFRIAALLLAAIAVSLVSQGVAQIVARF